MTWIDRLEQLRREQNPSRYAPKRERPALRIPSVDRSVKARNLGRPLIANVTPHIHEASPRVTQDRVLFAAR